MMRMCVYVSVMGRADGPKPTNRSAEPCRAGYVPPRSAKMHTSARHPLHLWDDDVAAYAHHINELLRSLNVNDEEEAQPADTEQTKD